MNIAILTQPICNNYGGILQNYALQTVLERLGHKVITLNFPINPDYPGSPVRHLLSTTKRVFKRIAGDPSIIWADLAKESRKRVELACSQKRFLDNYLQLRTIAPPLTLEKVQDLMIDAYIVGSDQVWRPRYNHYIVNMFLDFTEGLDVKRIAYAASLGTDKWEFSEEETLKCRHLAARFDAISVREQSSVALLKDHLGVDSIHVLDPTLLLAKDDYLSFCSNQEHPYGDFIAVYLLDYSKEKLALLSRISKQLRCPLRFIGRFTRDGFPSVESWLEGIANAKYVLTDSFHGTVFSVIFNKQFVTLGNAVRGNSRFCSLFDDLGINGDRLAVDENKIVSLLTTPHHLYSTQGSYKRSLDRSFAFLKNQCAL